MLRRVALIALALLGASHGARADRVCEPGVALSVRGPEGCPARERLRDLLEAHLGRRLEERDHLTARIEISAEESGYLARVRVLDRGRLTERWIDGADCAELMDAVALILALQVVQVPCGEPEPPAPGEPAGHRDAPFAAADENRGRAPSLSLRLGAAGGLGFLPGAAFGAAVGPGLALRVTRDEDPPEGTHVVLDCMKVAGTPTLPSP